MYAQQQQQCPVCTLYLHPGMNLEIHLETHPKDQVIKALVSKMSQPSGGVLIDSTTAITRAPPPHPTNHNGHNAILYHDSQPNSIPTNLIEYMPQQTTQPPPSQPNFLIVNSTSTKFFRRSNAAIIINNQPPPPPHLLQNHPHHIEHNNHNARQQSLEIVSPKIPHHNNQNFNQSHNHHQRNNILDNSINHIKNSNRNSENATRTSDAAHLEIDNYENIPQKYDDDEDVDNVEDNNNDDDIDNKKVIDASTCNNSNNDYYDQDNSSNNPNNNHNISTEEGSPHRLHNITECDELGGENENDTSSQIAAKYFEQDNGDFVVQESPKSYVEYTENDEGDFMVTEKVVNTPLNILHFVDEEENEVNNENQMHDDLEEDYNENEEENTVPVNFSFSTKANNLKGLKVLSNVKLTPDMISSGIKEIISSAKSVNLNDSQNAKITPKITEDIELLSDDEYLVAPPSYNISANAISSPSSPQASCSKNVNNDPPLTTSVIRMASTTLPSDESTFKEPSKNSLLIQSKSSFKLNTLKKQPKILVVKLKKPLPNETDDITDSSEKQEELKVKTENPDNWRQPTSSKNYEDTIKLEIVESNESEVTADVAVHEVEPLAEPSNLPKKSSRIKKRRVSVKAKKFRLLNKITKCKEARKTKRMKLQKAQLQKPGHSKHCKLTKAIKQECPSSSRDLEMVGRNDIVEISLELHPENESSYYANDLPNAEGYVPPSIADFTNNLYSELKFEEPQVEEPSTSTKANIAVTTIRPIPDHAYPEVTIKLDKDDNPFVVDTNEANKSLPVTPKFEITKEEDNKDDISNVINDNADKDSKISVSWTSEITSAIETIESHSSDHLLPEYTCTTAEHTIQNENETKPKIAADVPVWKSNTQENPTNYDDINNQAGPSSSYRFPNFSMGNYDPEFLFPSASTDRNSRFLEFIDDNQETATWKHPFSPQYVNFENDRNSYMDLDTCKTTNLPYNRAPSTESINIRTDEKMPAKGEISEQESNGEVDVSWNHQMYQYCQQESLPKYYNPNEQLSAGTKEHWKPFIENNFQQFSHNIPKFNQSTEPILTYSNPNVTTVPGDIYIVEEKPDLDVVDTTTSTKKKEKKPRCYRCTECYAVFENLRLKRAHIKLHHPDSLLMPYKAPSVPTATSVIKDDNNELESKLFFSSITDTGLNMCTTFEFNRNEISVTAEPTVKTEEGAEVVNKKIMGFDELKNELLQTGTQATLPKPTGAVPRIIKILKVKNKKVYVCQKCNEEFKSIRCFDTHLGIHPAECQQCGKSFRHWSNLSVHVKRHLGIKNFACRCGKKFVLKQNLDEHMRIHTGTAPIVCTDCPRKFRRYSNLIQHRNRHHLNIRPEQKDYVCHCGEVFHTKAKFNWHKEIHDKKPKGCPYCRERFIHKNSLTRHIRLSHVEKYWFFKNQAVECPICHQLYLKTSIKHHINKHTVKTEFKCNICNKVFSTKWNLKQHRWIHACRSTKPYKCKVCTSAFVRESDYITHMNIHKSIKPFTCDYCGRQFSRKYNWLRHTREHELPKKFKCNICSKQFHRAYYLTEHSRVHTGERPYSCNICGKTSATKTNHNKHIVIHHARDPLAAEG